MTLFNPLYANRITLEIWLMRATCPPSEIFIQGSSRKRAQGVLTLIFVLHGLNLVIFFDFVSF